MSVQTTPHLNFRGDARAALELYRSVFGGELVVTTYGDLEHGYIVTPTLSDRHGAIRSGNLETSNVNVVEELVDMIETQRAYEVNSKMIKATDEMLQYVNQQL